MDVHNRVLCSPWNTRALKHLAKLLDAPHLCFSVRHNKLLKTCAKSRNRINFNYVSNVSILRMKNKLATKSLRESFREIVWALIALQDTRTHAHTRACIRGDSSGSSEAQSSHLPCSEFTSEMLKPQRQCGGRECVRVCVCVCYSSYANFACVTTSRACTSICYIW